MARSMSLSALLQIPVLLVLCLPSTAVAAKIYVANNGTDGGACGTKAAPCRSISQGIAQAGLGDTVSVGPGLYGDLNANGTLGDVGEEPLATCPTTNCMILVDKQVKILSEAGAFSTIIDPGNAVVTLVVGLAADGAVLGAKNKGFTIRGSGVATVFMDTGAANTVVAGNLIEAGSLSSVGIYDLNGSGGDRILDNRVIQEPGAVGIQIRVNDVVLTGNTATGGEIGIAIDSASGATLTSNVLQGNGAGLYLTAATNVTVTKCLFAGNWYQGVYAGGSTGSISASSFVGNGIQNLNCGYVQSGSTMTVTGNWWGAATGPGPDPADDACNTVAGDADPVATKFLAVKPKPLR